MDIVPIIGTSTHLPLIFMNLLPTLEFELLPIMTKPCSVLGLGNLEPCNLYENGCLLLLRFILAKIFNLNEIFFFTYLNENCNDKGIPSGGLFLPRGCTM